MYGNYEGAEAFDESLDEGYEEARRTSRPSRPPVRLPNRGSTYRTPTPAGLSNSPVTQTQLKEVTERIGAALKQTGDAVKEVDRRVRTVAGEQTRTESVLRKEMIDRKKEISAVRRDLQSTREVSALLPVLGMLAPGNPILAFAPMLMLGNDVSTSDASAAGSDGGGGLFGGMGNSSTGLVTLLALSGALNKP